MPSRVKAKLWDKYCETFSQFAGDDMESAKKAFNEWFVSHYEKSMAQLGNP